MKQIQAIDRQIDAVRRKLCRIERVNQASAKSWEQAWVKHPDLHAKETALFLRRDKLVF